MNQAKQGDTVSVHYTGTLADGTEFDSSSGGQPLDFTIGSGQILPGFEEAVVGMAVGESRTVTIDADEGYGPRDEGKIQELSRDMIPDDVELRTGMQLEGSTPSGGTVVVTVTEVGPETVTVDGNHPLAGSDLTFLIELVRIH